MTPTRSLVRDPNNKVIAGVCSGIANYFGWDPTVVRVVFAISLLFGGTGFLVYLVLWLVMPEGPVVSQPTEFVFEETVYEDPQYNQPPGPQYGPGGQNPYDQGGYGQQKP